MRFPKPLRCLFVLLALLARAPVYATDVIDFESLASTGGYASFVASPPGYSEDGFTFLSSVTSGLSFAFWHTDAFDFAGSTALFNNFGSETTTLTKDGGGTFSLHSIDLAELFHGTGLSVSVTFTGVKSDLSTVTETFTLDGTNLFSTSGISGFETFAFTGFDDLLSVSWDQVSSYHQFDNLVLNQNSPVPEPAFVQMAALLGLGGLALLRRRKSRG